MKNLQRWIVTCAMAFALCVAFQTASAQNESGRRSINKERFQPRNWYDNTTAMYQLQYPILRSLPPLSSSMPYDILLSYIYLDSMARFDTARFAAQYIDRWQAMSDTLKGMLTYYYKVVDYNPIIFNQYISEVSLKRDYKYRASLREITEKLRSAFMRAAPNKRERLAIYSLLYPDYILRVKVNRIDSMLFKPFPSTVTPYQFQVTAVVLDTIKGHVISTCNDQYRAQNRDGKPLILAEGPNPCIHFTYTHAAYTHPSEDPQPPYRERDSEFIIPGTDNGGFGMKVGQEAIVFLSHRRQLYDSTHDYFDLDVVMDASYNALPIIDGQVRDVNRVWSDDLLMDYTSWINRVMYLRDKILWGNY